LSHRFYTFSLEIGLRSFCFTTRLQGNKIKRKEGTRLQKKKKPTSKKREGEEREKIANIPWK